DLDLAESLRNLDKLKLKAESMGGGRILGDVYREYSGVFDSFDDKPKALLYLQKALEEVKKDTFPGDLMPFMLQYDAGVLTAGSGDPNKAQDFYREPLEFCRRENIRHYGALMLTSLGRSFVKNEESRNITQGLAHLDEAEAMIRGMEETMVRSYIAIVRGEAFFRRDDFETASQHYKTAHKLFTQAQSDKWIGESAFWVAQSETKRKRYKVAMEWLTIAEKHFRATNNSDIVLYENLRAAIYKGMERYPEALEALEKSLKARDQIDKDTQKGEISKLRSQLEFTVQENQNELLKKDNALKSQQFQEAALIQKIAVLLAGASLLILVLFALSVRQTKKLKSAQARIHDILHYIEEGIITIGRGFRVEASLSPYIDHLIGRQPNPDNHDDVFHTLMQKVDLSAHEKQLIHDTLEACMDATFLTWELNHLHLPMEMTMDQGQKILALDWQPIIGRGQTIDRILLVLRDHTVRRQLERQLSLEQTRVSQTTSQIHEIIHAGSQKVRRFLDSFLRQQNEVTSFREAGNGAALARILHTLKGDARTLGLDSLVARTHALESELGSNMKNDFVWQQWHQHLLQYQSLLQNFDEQTQDQRLSGGSSLHEIAVEICDGLRSYMDQQGLILQRLCVDDGWGLSMPGDHDSVRLILLHSLTNAVDHGFVIPLKSHRFSRVHMDLTVRTALTPHDFHLTIIDNGAGIDRQALAEKYGRASPLSDQDVNELILKAGVTSAPNLTETSGRGIGLNAIHSLLQSWNGTVRLRSEPSGGTQLDIQWPRSAWAKTGSAS
ncbi:MAG: ATP-binding protein, partial [Pseudobdellovibrionaceae bacterium]|nr:ATP-binding protein [Pseudobdellovibrionaceae bacterium]